MRSTTFAKLAAVAVAVPLTLAACGGGETGSSAPGTTVAGTVAVGARDIAFDKKQYTAAAGEVTFVYLDEGNIPHTLLIEGVDGFKLRVDGNGDDDTGTVTLEPGEYLMYCDIPGHRPAMEATLTVT
jgi:plastocyanin